MAAINLLFNAWDRRFYKKLQKERESKRVTKCLYPCSPCTCKEGEKKCDGFDVCVKPDD
jgi:hypothetical protein